MKDLQNLEWPALSYQPNLLDILFDRMPMGIAVFDRDLVLLRCNPTWVSFVERYAPPSVGPVAPGLRFFDLAPGNEASILPLIERVLAGETVRQDALRLENDGVVSYWDVMLTPLVEDGQVAGIMSASTDVTRRKQAEEGLRKERNFISAVLDTAGALVVVLDREGRIVRFNQACEETTGYLSDEVRGEPLWDLFLIPEEVEPVKAVFEELRAGQFPNKYENYWVTKDGKRRLIAWSNTAILDADGSVEYVIGAGIDITERKQAEEALLKAHDELELRVKERTAELQRANESLKELIAERKQAERALQERLAFEKLITSISTEFINLGPEEIDAGIMHALEAIGRFANVDRSYVFLLSGDGTTMDNTHEWCAEGIEPQIQNLQAQPIETLPWSTAKIKRLETVHIPRVADLPPEAKVDQEQMRGQDIQSLILVPMVYRGVAVGFLGFDSVRVEKTWSEDVIALLRIVGEIIANALEHKRAQEALQATYQTLERRVEERTHELAALNAIAAVVSRSLDLKEIMSDALDKTLEVMGMDLGVAYRLEGSGDPSERPLLSVMAHRGISTELARQVDSLPLQGSMIEKAAAVEQPIVWQVTDYPNVVLRQAMEEERVRLGVSMPLLVKARLVGALVLAARDMHTFAPEELSLLAAVGQQIGVAVENARLYEQAEQAAVITERNRLARELHDSVTQALYSVTLFAEAAAILLKDGKNLEAAEHLRELRDTAQEALREMRLLIFELRPLALEKTGLVAALQTRLEAVEMRGGIKAELQVEGAPNAERLPFAVQEELYHIAQEALNNVLKHARAQHVQVNLQFLDTATSLEVWDDGLGFEPEGAREEGGLGLRGMKERAQRIDGKLRIESKPGKGTKVSIRVPTRSSKSLGIAQLSNSQKAGGMK